LLVVDLVGLSCGFCRAMLCIMQARPMPSYGVRVCVSVRLSRSWILSKRINISSKNFTVGQPHYSHFSVPNVMASFRREPLPQRGSRMRVGYAEIAILSQYLAPSCAVNAKCNTLSCDGPWRVDDTSRW